MGSNFCYMNARKCWNNYENCGKAFKYCGKSTYKSIRDFCFNPSMKKAGEAWGFAMGAAKVGQDWAKGLATYKGYPVGAYCLIAGGYATGQGIVYIAENVQRDVNARHGEYPQHFKEYKGWYDIGRTAFKVIGEGISLASVCSLGELIGGKYGAYTAGGLYTVRLANRYIRPLFSGDE